MYRLAQLAELIGAQLIGDAEAIVRRAQAFEAAGVGDITFAASAAYRQRLHTSAATAVIVSPPADDLQEGEASEANQANQANQTNQANQAGRPNLLLARDPKLAFARAVAALHAEAYTPTGVSADLVKGEGCQLGEDLSIHARVTLGRDCVIGDRVTLYPGVVLGDRCRIGDDTVIFANVAVYADCDIGDRCRIHAGAVIGADGFGFVAEESGRQVKLLQLGRVIIEDDCEIGANCAIDRGGFADTVLRRGVKLDNLIQVGHNCDIGEDTVIAALTGFSGGTRAGRSCIIGGQVGTQQHIAIGDRAVVMARAGVTKSVAAEAVVGGVIPAMPYNDWRRSQALYARLPELFARLKQLEKAIAKTESSSSTP